MFICACHSWRDAYRGFILFFLERREHATLVPNTVAATMCDRLAGRDTWWCRVNLFLLTSSLMKRGFKIYVSQGDIQKTKNKIFVDRYICMCVCLYVCVCVCVCVCLVSRFGLAVRR